MNLPQILGAIGFAYLTMGPLCAYVALLRRLALGADRG